jgi:hypothetical protein
VIEAPPSLVRLCQGSGTQAPITTHRLVRLTVTAAGSLLLSAPLSFSPSTFLTPTHQPVPLACIEFANPGLRPQIVLGEADNLRGIL